MNNKSSLERLAFKIVCAIEQKWPYLDWDSDEAYDIIWSMLPVSLAEAQVEWDEFVKKCESRHLPGPSLMEQLKNKLKLPREASLKQTLELVIIKLKP